MRRSSFSIINYTTDFDTTKKNVNFVISDAFFEITGSNAVFDALCPKNNREDSASKISFCGGTNKNFTIRYAIIETSGGNSYQIPITNRVHKSGLSQAAKTVKNSRDFECIHLIGERWSVVPNGEHGGEHSPSKTYDMPADDKKERIIFDYTHDVGAVGKTRMGKTTAALPEAMFNAAKACVTAQDNDMPSICETSRIAKPRHLIGVAYGKRGNNKFSVTSRSIPIDGVNVKQCAKSNSKDWVCYRYVGEDMYNINEFV